jgi:hypothetical protein
VAEVASLFRRAGLPVALCDDMPAWTMTHEAWISPFADAIYAAGGRRSALAGRPQALHAFASAMKLNFEALDRLRVPITPARFRLLKLAPNAAIVATLRLALRLPQSPPSTSSACPMVLKDPQIRPSDRNEMPIRLPPPPLVRSGAGSRAETKRNHFASSRHARIDPLSVYAATRCSDDGVPRSVTTRVSASTTAGSNWVPAQRRSSWSASGTLRACRYGRSVVMAENASQTQTMRAGVGIAAPARPSG